MKKIVVLIILSLNVFTAISQSTKPGSRKDSTDKYCAKLLNGKLVVMHASQQLTHDTTFNNGAILKADGSVIRLNGLQNLMKNGECVDQNGDIIPLIGKMAKKEEIEK